MNNIRIIAIKCTCRLKRLLTVLLFLSTCVVMPSISAYANPETHCNNVYKYTQLSKVNFTRYYPGKSETTQQLALAFKVSEQTIVQALNNKYGDCLIIPGKSGRIKIVAGEYLLGEMISTGVDEDYYRKYNRNIPSGKINKYSKKYFTVFFPIKKTISIRKKFVAPVKFSWIAGRQGPRRHPLTGRIRISDSISFGARSNLPVRSILDGIVVFSKRISISGNTVVIKHNNNLRSYYYRLGKIVVKKGGQVKAGQELGLTGNTAFNGCGSGMVFKVMKGNDLVNLNTIYIEKK